MIGLTVLATIRLDIDLPDNSALADGDLKKSTALFTTEGTERTEKTLKSCAKPRSPGSFCTVISLCLDNIKYSRIV